MSVWLTMLKKDVAILRNLWVGFVGIAVVLTAAALAANALGFMDAARAALIVGGVLIVAPFFTFPAQLYRGINKEVKSTPALWLHTPQSGWAMLASKLVSSLIGSLIIFIVYYFLALALFGRTNFAHILPPLHYQTKSFSGNGGGIIIQNRPYPLNLSPAHLAFLESQIPRIEFYVMMSLLACGLYVAMWIVLTYLSVHAVKNQLRKYNWLAGLGVILLATWGVGTFKSTAFFRYLFGWGRIPLLKLFPPAMHTVFPTGVTAAVIGGYLVFNALLMVLLFGALGLIIDRYLEA